MRILFLQYVHNLLKISYKIFLIENINFASLKANGNIIKKQKKKRYTKKINNKLFRNCKNNF